MIQFTPQMLQSYHQKEEMLVDAMREIYQEPGIRVTINIIPNKGSLRGFLRSEKNGVYLPFDVRAKANESMDALCIRLLQRLESKASRTKLTAAFRKAEAVRELEEGR